MATPAKGVETSTEDFPSEIRHRLDAFDSQLTRVESEVKNFLSTPLADLHERLSVVEKAKIDLIAAYTLNSLFWTYLVTRGESPREHAVKQELSRIKSCMQRAKEIEQSIKDKAKTPRVDTAAAKRVLKNALWTPQPEKSTENTTKDATVKNAKKNLWRKAHHKVDDELPQTEVQEPPMAFTPPTISPAQKRKSPSDGKGPKGKKNRKR